MDNSKLIAALDQAIAQNRALEEKVFLRLLKEVWQVDWTVAPYDVWTHMMEWDVPYFLRFMAVDEGDEADEAALISDWITARMELRKKTNSPDWKMRVRTIIEETNRLRVAAR